MLSSSCTPTASGESDASTTCWEILPLRSGTQEARRLFCARDHFGIKPFYYAQVLGGIVFSNTLDCIRLHPAVSDGLNEVAIGDFLLFGWNQDPSTTTFADIRRLAAAHTLTCEQGTSRARRYWTVPCRRADTVSPR